MDFKHITNELSNNFSINLKKADDCDVMVIFIPKMKEIP